MIDRRTRLGALCALLTTLLLLLLMSAPAVADPGNGNGKDKGQSGQPAPKDKDGGPGNGHGNGHANGHADDGGSSGSGDTSGGDSSGGDSSRKRSSTSGGDSSSRQSSSTSNQEAQQGNISCAEALGSGFIELKVEPPSSGTYSDGTLTVTVSRTGNGSFTWSSNIDLDAVIAKGGPTSNIYRYPGTSDGFSGSATTTINPSNNQPYGLSHISFCYDTGNGGGGGNGGEVCPPGTDLAGQAPPGGDMTKCDNPDGGEVCPPGTDMAGQVPPGGDMTQCDNPDSDLVCPEGTEMAGQFPPGGDMTQCDNPDSDLVCPEGTDMAGQFAPGGDLTLCDTDGGEEPLQDVCPEGTDFEGQPMPEGGIEACNEDDVLGDILTNDDEEIVGPGGDDVAASGTRPQSAGDGELPFTGANVLAVALMGFLITGSGVLLVRRSRD